MNPAGPLECVFLGQKYIWHDKYWIKDWSTVDGTSKEKMRDKEIPI